MTILSDSLVRGGCQIHKVEGLLQNREITPKPNLKPPPQPIENE